MHFSERLLALDGLRAFSILIVALSHVLGLCGISSIPGGFGVTVFFFISGFIITRLLLQEYAAAGRINLAAFYLRRAFRLMPALLAYVAICILVMSALGVPVPGSDILATLFYYANYHNIFVDRTAGVDGGLPPLAITWSLAIEEHFYFIFPVVLVALAAHMRKLMWSMVVFVALVLVWRLYLVMHYGLENLPMYRLYMATDTRLDSIVYGCLLSVIVYRATVLKDSRSQSLLTSLQGRVCLSVAGAFLLASFVWRSEAFRETVRYSMQGIALMPIFCALFWKKPTLPWLQALLSIRPMLFVGAISYSLYLYHFLALAVVETALPHALPVVQITAVTLLAAVGTLFSYYVVERPTRRIGSHLVARLEAGPA